MTDSKKHIELLAPAGNYMALQAAVCAGADAIYLGLDHFNARRGADNFTINNIKNACDYAHLRGVKIYLTLNIIVFENEFNDAMQMAYAAADAGVDAFIVQDVGIANAVAKEIPHVPLHISTQMNVHDEAGLRFAADLGAKRVCLAREMSVSEIANLNEVAKNLDVELECFGHGALCVCYSGQCLMSSMIGGRSANRGTCAQACRLNYELLQGKWQLGKKRYGEDDKRGEFLLSPKDLCTIDILPKIKEAGVSSLKIEGRMKSAEYVHDVISVYRRSIDNLYCEDAEYQVRDKDKLRLQEAFSRGFTTAYLENKRGNEIMSYKRPNNRGLNIGRVSGLSSKKLFIDTKDKLHNGDILEVWTKRGRTTVKLSDNFSQDRKTASILFNKSDNSIKNISKSDRVFRVRNAAAVFDVSEFEPRLNVDCKIELKLGQKSKIQFSHQDWTATLEGDIVEEARTKAVSEQDVISHIDRLGQTPFKLSNIEVELDDGVGIGFSALHHLRSDCLELLKNSILKSDRKMLGKRVFEKNKNIKKSKKPVTLTTSDDVFKTWEFCDSIGDLYIALSKGRDVEVGPHIPVTNVSSVNYFANLGCKKIWLSPELTLEQISDLISKSPDLSFGIFIMGPQELMIMRHCVLMSEGECSRKCNVCERRKKPHYLLDRKGYEFPVVATKKGNCHIYNSVSLDLCHCIRELIDAGVDSFLIDTTLMDEDEAIQAVNRASEAIEGSVEKSQNTTTGHLFRSVL